MKIKITRKLAELINNHPEISGRPVAPGETVTLTPSVLRSLDRTEGVVLAYVDSSEDRDARRQRRMMESYTQALAPEILRSHLARSSTVPPADAFAHAVTELASALTESTLAALHPETQE